MRLNMLNVSRKTIGRVLLGIKSLIPPVTLYLVSSLLQQYPESWAFSKFFRSGLLLSGAVWVSIFWFASELLSAVGLWLIKEDVKANAELPSAQVTNILLTEYREAREMATHQDKIIWQIGAILIAGSLAGLGFSLNKDTLPVYGIAIDTAAIVALSSWLMFVGRNRGFFAIYSARMREIERVLQMKAQIYIEDAQTGYVAPDGKQVTYAKPTGWTIARFLAIGLVVVLLWTISLLAQRI